MHTNTPCELLSKLLVSPLITPIVVPYIIPYIIPLFRSLDYSSFGEGGVKDDLNKIIPLGLITSRG